MWTHSIELYGLVSRRLCRQYYNAATGGVQCKGPAEDRVVLIGNMNVVIE